MVPGRLVTVTPHARGPRSRTDTFQQFHKNSIVAAGVLARWGTRKHNSLAKIAKHAKRENKRQMSPHRCSVEPVSSFDYATRPGPWPLCLRLARRGVEPSGPQARRSSIRGCPWLSRPGGGRSDLRPWPFRLRPSRTLLLHRQGKPCPGLGPEPANRGPRKNLWFFPA